MESAAHREDADNGGFVGSVSVDLSSSAEGAKGAILHDHAPLLAERSGNGRQVGETATAAGGVKAAGRTSFRQYGDYTNIV
jgi:hypothetical protein